MVVHQFGIWLRGTSDFESNRHSERAGLPEIATGAMREPPHAFRNASGSMSACFRMARSVPSLWHLTRMVRHSCVAVRFRIEPDLVTSSGLAVKSETAHLQLPDD